MPLVPCAECGYLAQADAFSCPRCGRRLAPAQRKTPATEKVAAARRTATTPLVVVLVSALFVVLVFNCVGIPFPTSLIMLALGALSVEGDFSAIPFAAAGIAAVLYLWASMLAACTGLRRGPKGRLLAAHVTFILLNLATMPMWMIEGNILYGIICGYTIYLLHAHEIAGSLPRRRRAPRRPIERAPSDAVPAIRR